VATLFVGLGFWIEADRQFMAFFVGMGVMMMLGAAFSFLNGRKMAKLSAGDAAPSFSKRPS
jgi:hypothetical protein